MPEGGYPHYRHRHNGQTFEKQVGGQTVYLDNCNVVPHSPSLTRRFNCHINVEACTSVTAIKYIHKYIYKGPDCASVRVGQDREDGPDQLNEVKMHLDVHWISAHEAAWCLLGFLMHQEIPNIV